MWRLKQTNLARKNDIGDFIKKTDFDEKLWNIGNRVISNKTKQVDTDKKLTDHQNYSTKLIKDLLKDVWLMSMKGLTKNLINGYIFNNERHFSNA